MNTTGQFDIASPGDTMTNGQVRTITPDTRSLTTGTGATGFQISATNESSVCYTVSTSTTATIGGASTSDVVMEMCSTNSITPSDWIEIGHVGNSQTISLAVVLQSTQVFKGQMCADVPTGYYLKLRSSGTGTHTEAFVSGQKTIIG